MTDLFKYIPLLSVKPLNEWTPTDYKIYIESLYAKPVKNKTALKKEKKPFTFRLNKKGGLVLQVNRRPKWLTRDEVDGIAKATGLPLNDVWVKVLKRKVKNPIQVVTNAEDVVL